MYDFKTINKRYNRGSGKWNEMEKYGVKPEDGIVPFSVADMEFVTAPEIVENLKYQIDNFVLGYENPTPEYLNTVCDWMKRRHNWDAKPEWIMPSPGVIDAFNTAINVYTDERDGVMLMTPVYYPMYIGIEKNNRVLVDNHLIYKDGEYTIDFEDFEQKAKDPKTKMLILCSPHNPTGRVWTKEELERISNICLENDVLVVSDEIHHDLVMPGYEHICYATLSKEAEENSLILTAPSKTFNLAGLQTSNIFVPNDELREQYLDYIRKSNPNPKNNILGYYACKTAYAECEQWLEEALEVIYENYKLLKDFFETEFPKSKVATMEATYLLWVDFTEYDIDYKELERINKEEARLFLDEGYIFGERGEGFNRWNLACPTSEIEKAIDRMKEVYPKYMK